MIAPAPILNLRPHQEAALAAIEMAIGRGELAGLVVMPTGCGKTALFLTLARKLSVPALVLVHRDVLVRQSVESAATWWPEATVGVIQGDRDEWQHADLFGGRPPDLVVASVPSLQGGRLASIPADRFGLVISDEAHRSVSAGWSRVVQHFKPGFHLGVTATPDRLDRKGLGVHFGKEPLFAYHLHQAIADGALVRLRQRAFRTGISLDALESLSDEATLSKEVNTLSRNLQVVTAYLEAMPDRRAVAFAVDVPHVLALVEAFRSLNVPAVAITGEDRKRRDRDLADFKAGVYRVAVNCEVLGEGFDDPEVSGVLWCRPTASKAFLMQGIGRGLRLFPGKADCLVVDFVDVSRRHKLVNVCDLLGVKARDAEGGDVLELAARERLEEQEREAAVQRELLASPLAWRLEEVSPWPDLPSLDGYLPGSAWHGEPATDRQRLALSRHGLAARRDLTRGEASWLLDRAREYDVVFPLPATLKQERFLRRMGEWEDGLSRRDASRRISRLKGATVVARGG